LVMLTSVALMRRKRFFTTTMLGPAVGSSGSSTISVALRKSVEYLNAAVGRHGGSIVETRRTWLGLEAA
jgi:hypothetical protein